MQNRSLFPLSLLIFSVVLLVFLPQPIFAQKTLSVQHNVDGNRDLLLGTFYGLENYASILPDHVKASRLLEDDVIYLKIGTGLISTDANVKRMMIDNMIIFDIISGDLKDTRISISLDDNLNPETVKVSIDLELHTSWYLQTALYFVSDDDIESFLFSSIEAVADYSANPQSNPVIQEEPLFCVLGFCF